MNYKAGLGLLFAVAVAGCQQGQAANEDRLPPAPLVEQIDPQKDPIAAVKARDKQMNMANNPDVGVLRRDALALIGDASADDNSQCRIAGFGHKPCGGPARYVAYSTKNGNEAEILRKIAAYNAAHEAENMRLGRLSDCAVVPKPEVALSGGQCKLVNNRSY